MVLAKESYQDILLSEYEKRLQQNSAYSLRAYARDLEISPGALSDVLNFKLRLSPKKALVISRFLALENHEAEYFCALVAKDNKKNKILRNQAKEKIEQLREKFSHPHFATLQQNLINILSSWHHFAILELTYLDDFSSDHEWIANELGISRFEVDEAIRRLIAIKMLRKSMGRYHDNIEFAETMDDVPSLAVKKYHEAAAHKSIEALYSQDLDEREFGTNIFALSSADLSKLKRKIRSFRQSMEIVGHNAKNKNSVYCLSLQFYRLNRRRK